MAHLLEHLLFKGTPTTRERLGRVHQARPARQRHHLVRPHQLLRQLLGQRRQPALVPRLAGRRDDQQLHRPQRPRHRDDGRAQRDGARREQPEPRAAAADAWPRCTSGTTTARRRSARAPTSRTSTSRACRPSTAHYYQPDNATLIVSGRFDAARVLALVAAGVRPDPAADARRSPPTYTLDPAQDGERTRHAAPRRRRAADLRRLPRAAGVAAPTSPRRRCSRRCSATRPAAACTSSWSSASSRASTFGFALSLAEPSPLLPRRRARADAGRRQGARRDAARPSIRCASEPVTAEELERRAHAVAERLGQAASPIPSGSASRSPKRSPRATGGSTSCSRDQVRKVDAGRHPPGRHRAAAPRQPHRRHLPADGAAGARAGAGAGRRRRAGQGLQGRPGAAQAESFDADAGQPRCRAPSASSLDSGLKVALLPKGTRGQAVQARLRLRFGDVADA